MTRPPTSAAFDALVPARLPSGPDNRRFGAEHQVLSCEIDGQTLVWCSPSRSDAERLAWLTKAGSASPFHIQKHPPESDHASSLNQSKQPASGRRWEKAVLVLSLASALASMTKPTPMLQTLDLGMATRLFPKQIDGPRDFEIGQIEIRPATAAGCIEVHSAETQVLCNPHLWCATGKDFPSRFEVFRTAEDSVYVETGSQCNSSCCDWRGASLSIRGARLDDGIHHRVLLRLGVPGCISAVVGVTALLRRRRGPLVRVMTIGGLGLASALLWWSF